MLFLCAAYVFGCAFRSFLPRADVQRICLFDTWLSSVLIGRSVATVAEVCFAAQWAIVLHQLGGLAGADTTVAVAWMLVPMIVVAQCCSWYGVLTTNYLANAIENSIWAVAFFAVGIALCRLLPEFEGRCAGRSSSRSWASQPIWLSSSPSTYRCTSSDGRRAGRRQQGSQPSRRFP